MASPRFQSALNYVAGLHASQKRKGTEIPYLCHLMAVAARVYKSGGDEDTAIAALLHDALEDQADQTSPEEIENNFGAEVRRLVEEVTDETPGERDTIPWRQRKDRYLAHIADLDAKALLIVVCDKLDNLEDILADFAVHGPKIWQRFTGKESGMRWFMPTLGDTFADWLTKNQSTAEIRYLIQKYQDQSQTLR